MQLQPTSQLQSYADIDESFEILELATTAVEILELKTTVVEILELKMTAVEILGADLDDSWDFRIDS